MDGRDDDDGGGATVCFWISDRSYDFDGIQFLLCFSPVDHRARDKTVDPSSRKGGKGNLALGAK